MKTGYHTPKNTILVEHNVRKVTGIFGTIDPQAVSELLSTQNVSRTRNDSSWERPEGICLVLTWQ